MFTNDETKQFSVVSEWGGETAQLTLSLDVVYHLIEDDVFYNYMRRLFDASEQYVIIYSSNTNEQIPPVAPHVKHRKFTEWVEENMSNWKLLKYIPNKYPHVGRKDEGSFADFYIYKLNNG